MSCYHKEEEKTLPMIWIDGEKRKAGRCVAFRVRIVVAPDVSDEISVPRRPGTTAMSSASNHCDFAIIRA